MKMTLNRMRFIYPQMVRHFLKHPLYNCKYRMNPYEIIFFTLIYYQIN